jgi:3-oxoacyl-[acyl-carrier protein] reductase
VDVLVNNAGGPRAGGFDALDDDAWQEGFELNLLSAVRLIRGVLPHMREQGWGRIVTIASSSIKQPLDNLLLSNTYRVAILGLAKSLAIEFAPDGVLVNTVGPGRIDTDRVAGLDATRAEKAGISIEEVRKQTEKAIPLGRYGTAEEFAKVATFLLSGANTYLTGQHFLVDGAMVKAI